MKKYRIIFNSSIYQKLEDILAYIAMESTKTAIDVIDGIEKQIMSLELMPERFPLISEKIIYKNYQLRHFFYKKSFRIIYTIYRDVVRILDVRHGSQDYLLHSDFHK